MSQFPRLLLVPILWCAVGCALQSADDPESLVDDGDPAREPGFATTSSELATCVLSDATPGACMSGVTPAPACGAAVVQAVLAPATAAAPSVALACSLKIPRELNGTPRTITKALVIAGAAASGVVLDCDGATLSGPALRIAIQAQKHVDPVTGALSWSRPTGVTVKNCVINGAVRVFGMATNGQGLDLRDSSRLAGHTQRAQAAAPRNILFDHVQIAGAGGIPFYVSPGVTHLSLLRSSVAGQSSSVAVYFDAESGHNLLKDNRITASTGRELIAVDGSAYNRIENNYFSNLSLGGIYLYRNCGEGGTIRHQAPVWNEIINNVFFYNKYLGFNPSIWVASRNGWSLYCGDDAGYPFGSSVNNNDLAKDTVIAENQIYKLGTSLMIRIDDSPEHLFLNQSVTTSVARPAGCYVKPLGTFLRSAESTSFVTGTGPSCLVRTESCINGDLTETTKACP